MGEDLDLELEGLFARLEACLPRGGSSDAQHESGADSLKHHHVARADRLARSDGDDQQDVALALWVAPAMEGPHDGSRSIRVSTDAVGGLAPMDGRAVEAIVRSRPNR